jgi:hypothetical protein
MKFLHVLVLNFCFLIWTDINGLQTSVANVWISQPDENPAFSSAVMTDIPRENDKEQMLDVKKW